MRLESSASEDTNVTGRPRRNGRNVASEEGRVRSPALEDWNPLAASQGGGPQASSCGARITEDSLTHMEAKPV